MPCVHCNSKDNTVELCLNNVKHCSCTFCIRLIAMYQKQLQVKPVEMEKHLQLTRTLQSAPKILSLDTLTISLENMPNAGNLSPPISPKTLNSRRFSFPETFRQFIRPKFDPQPVLTCPICTILVCEILK